MGKSNAPTPPDPRQTAAAQTGTNIGTAVANNAMGMVNQVTPFGSLTYTRDGGTGAVGGTTQRVQTGTERVQRQVWDARKGQFKTVREDKPVYENRTTPGASGGGFNWTDPFTGETYNLPQYTATVSLSPEEQEKLRLTQGAETSLLRTAGERANFLEGYLPGTQSLTDQIEGRLTDLGRTRLDPRFEQEEDRLRTRLANQGLTQGSTAWDREMERFGQNRNDAYNQLMLQGRGQALSEVNNPINQITALLSGTQINNPGVSMAQPARIPTTDVAGLIGDNYQSQLANWQNRQNQQQGLLGGLFGAGARLVSGGMFG